MLEKGTQTDSATADSNSHASSASDSEKQQLNRPEQNKEEDPNIVKWDGPDDPVSLNALILLPRRGLVTHYSIL